MRYRIKENIGNPEKLEQLYHEDKKLFVSGFEEVFPEIEGYELARFWKIRLDAENIRESFWKVNLSEILIVLAACLTAGFLIKMPDIFNIRMTNIIFYERNAAIIVFLGLTIYSAWINRTSNWKKIVLILISFVIPAIYINLLPSSVVGSSAVRLAYIHLPLLMWCIYGMVFIDFDLKDKIKRLDFIRYNGDLLILSGLIAIAGGILTAVTIGLFEALEINIEEFYMKNIVIVGVVSVPVVATYIIKNYPAITNKIAPLIAAIFSPLVLISAVVYLAALLISEKDLFNNREFLLIFNIMLIGVMAVIVFSVSETSRNSRQKFSEMILFLLSIVTVAIDLIALSAIFYRLGSYGISPNRLAVLGSNVLILINLVLILLDLYKVNFRDLSLMKVGLTISKYLPVYIIWIFIVIFGFPLIFGI
ncbi:MAG: DUF4153 domain-containing protein [Bacteroidales bacterium]|nr:DUF4153 domain-containing protein [Bacteroidales bacterium]